MAATKQKQQININKEDPEKLYELVELVGTGSYGEVFKVFHPNLIPLALADLYLRVEI